MRTAVVGGRAVIALGDAETMGRAIRAVRGQGGVLTDDAAVADAVARIPAGAIGQAVLSVPGYLNMMLRMTDQMIVESLSEAVRGRAVLEAPPMPAAPGLGKPTAVGLYLDGRTLRLRADVPASEVRAARDISRVFEMRMQWMVQEHMKWMQEQQRRAEESPPVE